MYPQKHILHGFVFMTNIAKVSISTMDSIQIPDFSFACDPLRAGRISQTGSVEWGHGEICCSLYHF